MIVRFDSRGYFVVNDCPFWFAYSAWEDACEELETFNHLCEHTGTIKTEEVCQHLSSFEPFVTSANHDHEQLILEQT